MISSSDEQNLDVPATGLGYVRHREEIVREIDRLRLVLASGADLTRQVPTCPDWTLDDLVRHTGGAVRWATHLVRERAQENIPEETVPGARDPPGPPSKPSTPGWRRPPPSWPTPSGAPDRTPPYGRGAGSGPPGSGPAG